MALYNAIFYAVWFGAMALLNVAVPYFREIDTVRGPAVMVLMMTVGQELGHWRRRRQIAQPAT
jgi:hypothetical protein